MDKQGKTYTPRSTDQARQPPSRSGERGTASEVVGLDSKSASLSSINVFSIDVFSIDVSLSPKSLCFSHDDTVSCDPDESVITKIRMAARQYKSYHVFVFTNGAVENIGNYFGAALEGEPLERKST